MLNHSTAVCEAEILDLGPQLAMLCPRCHGEPFIVNFVSRTCENCNGAGYVDELGLLLDPTLPCDKLPGSKEKGVALAVRYAFGVCLWHPEDARDDQ